MWVYVTARGFAIDFAENGHEVGRPSLPYGYPRSQSRTLLAHASRDKGTPYRCDGVGQALPERARAHGISSWGYPNCRYIGGACLQRLIEDGGFRITALVRDAEKAHLLNRLGVATIVGSLDDSETLARAAAAADVVFHAVRGPF